MTPSKHDTTHALPPVDGTVTVCANHQETVKDIYDAIKKSCDGKMSKSQTAWTIGVLMAVAATFGVALWTTTFNATSKNDDNIVAMDKRVLTLELKWEGVQRQLDRIESEAKLTRAETNQQLEGLRRAIQEKKP